MYKHKLTIILIFIFNILISSYGSTNVKKLKSETRYEIITSCLSMMPVDLISIIEAYSKEKSKKLSNFFWLGELAGMTFTEPFPNLSEFDDNSYIVSYQD